MRNVVLAVLPVAGFSVYAFGLTALLLLVVTTASSVLTERLICRLKGIEATTGDWSAAVTGVLLGLTLPPGLPLWMAAVGGFIAIALGKSLFGGLGFNPFNPALVGRAFLQAAFPVSLTTWVPPFFADRFSSVLGSSATVPFGEPVYDAVTTATPLAAMKFGGVATDTFDLALGFIGGSAGETSAVLILVGGLYLAWRNMLNWKIPVSICGSVFVLSGLFHWMNPQAYPSPIFMLLSGGLLFGAVFMATDMVSSPMTSRGVVVYGALIGLLVVVVRLWGGLPEGVMYAILFGNACAPLIERYTQPRVYGTGKRKDAS
jgi:electron transport complex protein RnfD